MLRWFEWVLLVPMILGPATFWVAGALVGTFALGFGLGAWLW